MHEEIKKHTQKIYNEVKNPKHQFGEKIKEITIEIFIIVFAVSLSIWLHSWSEHKHQQKEVKEFLIGLRNDLKSTIFLTKEATLGFKEIEKKFVFLSKLDKNTKPNQDSLDNYFKMYYVSSILPNSSSRYEGFKSSGKIGFIENEKLAQKILNFYQEDLPIYYGTMNAWNSERHKLRDFVTDNLEVNKNGTDNRFQVLTMPKANNLIRSLIPWPQLFERHEMIIEKAETIITEIDKELKE